MFARGHAEFFQNVVVVEFKRAFADIKDVGDFVCGLAVNIQVENLSFRFREFFQPGFERLVVVRIDFVFAGIRKPFDFGLSLVDFGGLVFGDACKFLVLAFQLIRFEIAQFILFGKVDEQVVDFDNVGVVFGVLLLADLFQIFYA